jgi:hypothetical protein
MEMGVHALSLSTATKPITAEYDPYKIYQVHDYKDISFFRQDPAVKEASKETIKVLAQGYPELLKEKFFVNVPAIMGFMYAFMKLFVAAKSEFLPNPAIFLPRRHCKRFSFYGRRVLLQLTRFLLQLSRSSIPCPTAVVFGVNSPAAR